MIQGAGDESSQNQPNLNHHAINHHAINSLVVNFSAYFDGTAIAPGCQSKCNDADDML